MILDDLDPYRYYFNDWNRLEDLLLEQEHSIEEAVKIIQVESKLDGHEEVYIDPIHLAITKNKARVWNEVFR